MKRIFFTGGGTAGHVTPNLAIIEKMLDEGWVVDYVGSSSGIEATIVSRLPIEFHSISTGKLRRYFDWQNCLDPLKIILGIFQSLWLCLRLRPAVVFSKGGFVAVPLVVAAWICRIPIIAHESDITPGLANKLCFPFVRKICVNFEETGKYLGNAGKASKVLVTGSPVRSALRNGDANRGRSYLGFTDERPILLVFGGSLGAMAINNWVWSSLDELLGTYQIIHVVGSGNRRAEIDKPGYRQAEFLHEEFGDVLKAADIVLSRAGANSIYELLVMRKVHLLIPLTSKVSRGDQLVNARIFEAKGMSRVIQEESLADTQLPKVLQEVLQNKQQQIENISGFQIRDSVTEIVKLLTETSDQN